MLRVQARVALEALHPMARERVLVPPDRDADSELVVALLADVEVLGRVAEHSARLAAVVALELGLGLTCKRVGAKVLSLGAAFGGLAGGFEGAGAAAQEEGEHPGPRL